MVEMQQEMMARLDGLTIEDLCKQARKLRVPRESVDVPDFSI